MHGKVIQYSVEMVVFAKGRIRKRKAQKRNETNYTRKPSLYN
jgi:hypothetical protein